MSGPIEAVLPGLLDGRTMRLPSSSRVGLAFTPVHRNIRNHVADKDAQLAALRAAHVLPGLLDGRSMQLPTDKAVKAVAAVVKRTAALKAPEEGVPTAFEATRRTLPKTVGSAPW
jgi:hypothetical protein